MESRTANSRTGRPTVSGTGRHIHRDQVLKQMALFAREVAAHLPLEKVGRRRRHSNFLREFLQVHEIVESGSQAPPSAVLEGNAGRKLHVGVVGEQIRVQNAVGRRRQDAERPCIPVDGRVVVLVLERAGLTDEALLLQIADRRPQGDRVRRQHPGFRYISTACEVAVRRMVRLSIGWAKQAKRRPPYL